jgi:formylglycine-generating enzyme required for sulfatase activity
MGSIDGGVEETPIHTVSVSMFWMDTLQVRQADYQQLLGVNPSGHGGNYPIEYITWYDAALYCNARSKHDALDTVYSYTGLNGIPGNNCKLTGVTINYTNNGYRLPTEAEWEYACRAGSTTKYYFGDSPAALGNYAWFSDNSGGYTQTGGKKLPNQFGLYDMHGNVWEWCNDWYSATYYSVSPSTDPRGPAGTANVMRGGCYQNTADYLRSAYRNMSSTPDKRYPNVGFRVVRPAQ